MSEPILYVIARNDLDSLNPGKLAAQVAHATSHLAETIYNEDCSAELIRMYSDWCKQGIGFGTTIVLEASLEELDYLDNHNSVGKPKIYDLIIDPTYPFQVNTEFFNLLKEAGKIVSYEKIDDNKYIATRKEHTCSYMFGLKDDIKDVVSHLNLYK